MINCTLYLGECVQRVVEISTFETKTSLKEAIKILWNLQKFRGGVKWEKCHIPCLSNAMHFNRNYVLLGLKLEVMGGQS